MNTQTGTHASKGMPPRLYRRLYSYSPDFHAKISIATHGEIGMTSTYSQSSSDWAFILSEMDSVFNPLLSALEAERFEGGLRPDLRRADRPAPLPGGGRGEPRPIGSGRERRTQPVINQGCLWRVPHRTRVSHGRFDHRDRLDRPRCLSDSIPDDPRHGDRVRRLQGQDVVVVAEEEVNLLQARNVIKSVERLPLLARGDFHKHKRANTKPRPETAEGL